MRSSLVEGSFLAMVPTGTRSIAGYTPGAGISPSRLTFDRGYTNICSMTVACALIPRFQLQAALGAERRGMLRRPAAVAPEPGAAQLLGEVSAPAEKLGVRAGM